MSSPIFTWADQLVRELRPERNVYGSHPTYVEWSDPATGKEARNRSVCSSFVSHCLERAYGYTSADIGAWFGVPVPQARDYHRAVVRENGFERVFHAWAIGPGDLIAVRYPTGSRPTGHVMIAASAARERAATRPLERGTRQFEVDVIDSANSGHGTGDTRHLPNGTSATGVGRGTLRIYVASDDLTAGYAWSVLRVSKFEPERVRNLAIGRYDRARAPAPSGVPGVNRPAPDEGTGADSAPESND